MRYFLGLVAIIAVVLAWVIPARSAPEQTTLVKHINQTTFRSGPAMSYTPQYLIAAGNKVFFINEDLNNRLSLWVSDGTDQGTRIIYNLDPGQELGSLSPMLAGRNEVYFFYDGLWKSDGTTAGTTKINTSSQIDCGFIPQVDVNGMLFSVSASPNGSTLR